MLMGEIRPVARRSLDSVTDVDLDDLTTALQEVVVDAAFSGVVRIDRGGLPVLQVAHGDAHRGLGVANQLDTIHAMASGSKVFTACGVLSLVDEGVLDLDEPVRRWLGNDLPDIADDVTLRHLLSHRSGIGDYLDESVVDDVTDHVMPEPVHRYATTEAFVPTLQGHPTAFPAGERFAYCNGGFVVAALVAERASGTAFHDLVQCRVLAPAGLVDTAYLRTDSLPGRVAVGYLYAPHHADALRTNALHLPVRGNGDGGAFTTVADMAAFWAALVGGRVLPPALVRAMATPTSDTAATGGRHRYGLGVWLAAEGDGLGVVGYDAGVSFRSVHRPSSGLTWTVVSNWSDGAWPVVALLERAFPVP